VDGVHVPYHLIDIMIPDEDFSVFEYQKRFYRCFSELSGRGILPVMVGGTGLYIESVIQGYKMCNVPENMSLRQELSGQDTGCLIHRFLNNRPVAHNTTDLLDRSRLIRAIEIAEYTERHPPRVSLPRIEPLIIGIHWDRQILRWRITERLKLRLSAGMILVSTGKDFPILDLNIDISASICRGNSITVICSGHSIQKFISLPRDRKPGSGEWNVRE
jgi:tRNA dimethylallyltransferase